jgi:hypothetical protein
MGSINTNLKNTLLYIALFLSTQIVLAQTKCDEVRIYFWGKGNRGIVSLTYNQLQIKGYREYTLSIYKKRTIEKILELTEKLPKDSCIFTNVSNYKPSLILIEFYCWGKYWRKSVVFGPGCQFSEFDPSSNEPLNIYANGKELYKYVNSMRPDIR